MSSKLFWRTMQSEEHTQTTSSVFLIKIELDQSQQNQSWDTSMKSILICLNILFSLISLEKKEPSHQMNSLEHSLSSSSSFTIIPHKRNDKSLKQGEFLGWIRIDLPLTSPDQCKSITHQRGVTAWFVLSKSESRLI